MFSLGQANNKKGKLLVSGNTQGEFGGGTRVWRRTLAVEADAEGVFVKKLISMRLKGAEAH